MRIRQARNAVDMTQAELAKRVNTNRETMCRIESGRSHPRLSVFFHIAEALDVPLTQLLGIDK